MWDKQYQIKWHICFLHLMWAYWTRIIFISGLLQFSVKSTGRKYKSVPHSTMPGLYMRFLTHFFWNRHKHHFSQWKCIPKYKIIWGRQVLLFFWFFLSDWNLIGHVKSFHFIQRRQLTVVKTKSSIFKILWCGGFVVTKQLILCLSLSMSYSEKKFTVMMKLSHKNWI